MLAILVMAAYLTLWPVPIKAVSWQAPVAPGYTGDYAVNRKLVGLHTIALGDETGPEHIAIGADGRLYFGVASGHILRMNADGGAQEVFASTGGRPLGMDFDAQGRLIVADAIKGLLAVAADGKVALLTNAADGQALGLPNAVVVARNGKIYFSDSSARFGAAKWGGTLEAATLDIMEQSATGRVLEYDPATQATRVVAQGLSLANGVVLSADQQWLLVAESGRYRVWKIAVDAQRVDVQQGSAQAQVLFDNLPGYPDNLMRGRDSRIWLGLAGPRNDLDKLSERPWLRQLALRLPRALLREPKPYGHVMAFTEDGKVVGDLQDPDGHSFTTTGATEMAERLYIQSVNGTSIGWLTR